MTNENTPNTDATPLKRVSGLKRIWNAFFYSIAGLKAAYTNEAAFRQEVWLAIVLIPTALFLPVPFIHKSLLISSVILVLLTELLNSGIEAVVDRISYEHHELSKRAKDIGSAAVLMSLLIVVVVWSGVLLERIGV